MDIKEAVNYVAKRFRYKADRFKLFDWWFVMRERDGIMEGDCDDFAITSIWRACDCDIMTFLIDVVIFHKYKVHFAKTQTGGKHAVGSYGDYWFDNWTKEAVTKEEFIKRTGHSIKFFFPSPIILLYMLFGVLVRNMK